MRHVVVMTSASSVGLMTLFIVDLADMYFLSLLGESELAAAVGYGGTILFFTTSIGIGIAIATGALISRSIGAQNKEKAREYCTNVCVFGFLLSLLISIILWFNIPALLSLIGATGRSLELATSYLQIIIPSMAFLCLAMCGTSALRANGDARRSMMATVWGGIVNAALDPLLIFYFEMGIQGAAWASVAARLTVMILAIGGITKVHDMIAKFNTSSFFNDLKDITKIAIPSILTNVATPIGNAYVISSIAKFGDSAVAGMSVIGRLMPVAFGIVFALSSAIGPIIGQNFGAGKLHRVKSTIRDALIFSSIVVLIISIILLLTQEIIVSAFSASGDAAALIRYFCTWIAISFVFNGMLFITNASFNNLGLPHYSTIFNFTKATLGTIPFVFVGAMMAQEQGVLAGQAVGSVLVAIVALYLCLKRVNRLSCEPYDKSELKAKPFNPRIPVWPQSNTRG